MKNTTLAMLVTAITISFFTSASNHQPKKGLADFPYTAAAVLPIVALPVDAQGNAMFIKVGALAQKQLLTKLDSQLAQGRTGKFAILSRELATGRSDDAGKYDSFSGSKEKYEKHPSATAAHEFFEEANTEFTMGLKKEDVANYIDPESEHTEFIIAQEAAGKTNRSKGTNYVTYVVNVPGNFAQKLANWFTIAFNKATDWHFKEKDVIALVKYDDLINAIRNNRSTVQGQLLAAKETLEKPARKKSYTTEDIETIAINQPAMQPGKLINLELRPILQHALRSFALDLPYTPGKNKVIRFYPPAKTR